MASLALGPERSMEASCRARGDSSASSVAISRGLRRRVFARCRAAGNARSQTALVSWSGGDASASALMPSDRAEHAATRLGKPFRHGKGHVRDEEAFNHRVRRLVDEHDDSVHHAARLEGLFEEGVVVELEPHPAEDDDVRLGLHPDAGQDLVVRLPRDREYGQLLAYHQRVEHVNHRDTGTHALTHFDTATGDGHLAVAGRHVEQYVVIVVRVVFDHVDVQLLEREVHGKAHRVLHVTGCGPDGDALHRLLLGLVPVTLVFAFLIRVTRPFAEIHAMLRWLGVPLGLLLLLGLR